MKKIRTPILDRLKEHYEGQQHAFHVPGHKFGELWKDECSKQNLLSLDATELVGLDDLHDPSGIIKEAQERTAQFYHADHTFFLVNGTTVGNLAMILATCRKGSKVLVQRNCHKSIMNGLELAEVTPVFITPEMDKETGVTTSISLSQVKKAYQLHASFDAVILTNPNYYGMTADLTEIIAYIHKQNNPVLVDEAHGAHFSIGEPFPPSALTMGADVVVQSAHKTLPAMTMASYMHVRSNFIEIRLLEEKLQMLQSSSPSYLLMASLDYASAYLQGLERQDLDELMESIQIFKRRLEQIPQVKVVQGSIEKGWNDPLKLILQTRTSLSGYELQMVLEKEGIYTELADPYNVLFVLPLEPIKHIDEIVAKMKHALHSYPVFEKRDVQIDALDELPGITEIETSNRDLSKGKTFTIPIEEADGEISAESVIPYPPGIPVLLKGERITKAHIEYIQTLLNKKARFQGNRLEEGISVIRKSTN
ncbi:aminotransferase class I/II-fold pyridoxal phosphate-dependent enzyme [Pseudalkalibacillus sp. SCS-8]|uniref:aminotransferase class I/II-fold pyridoxal phosphate-dependent enzyme n=1 Tax=Pseudalkalibacillus nanhaiensis TaxID=3115291 RepID=UPI0032DBDF55